MRKGNKYILLLAAFLSAVTSLAQKNVVDEIVWVVGDEPILRSDVEKRRNEYGSSISGNPYCVIPEQLAVQKLFLHQAAIDSIEVTDAEEYMQMNMKQIREELFDQYKSELTARKMRDQLTSDIKVTPAEVRRFFKDVPEDSLPLIPTQVEVQVLVLQPRIKQEEIDRVKDILRSYAERVSNGSTSFGTLARLYSEDPGSARQGGELPFMGRGELDPAFANVAFSLTDPSKVSKIVKSDFGYHIIQLIEKRGDKLKCRHILKRPEVAQADIDTAMAHLDSIAEDIRTQKISFENAVLFASDDKDSRNNHGILTNTKENGDRTTRFEMSELSAVSSDLARVVEGMQTGEISKPFTMVNSKGSTVCALVRLKSRIKSHRANIAEDFQVLKDVVENQRSQERILSWIKEKQKSTYIRIIVS